MMRFLLTCFFFFVTYNLFAVQKDWRGTTNSDWNTAGNWAPAGVPGTGDDVYIGVNYTPTNQAAIVTGTGNCKTLTFGTSGISNVLTLTVNGTLNIGGAFLQRHDGGGVSITTTLTGTGTINCGGSFTVGHNVGNLNLFNTNTTTVKCNIALLKITGDLVANSYSYSFFGVANFINNALFDLANDNPAGISSVVEVTGQLKTTNQTPITGTTAIIRISEPGNNLAIMRMYNVTPVVVQSATYGAVDFYSATGGTGATAEYAATSGNQTVYTSSTSGVGQNPSVYQNIRFSGAGTKSLSSTNAITIAGNWVSSGGAIDVTGAPVIFQGTTAQSLTDAGSNGGAGVVFKNVTFQGGNTKTISGTTTSAFSISNTGVLTMAAATTLTVGSNGKLTLISDATGDARVAAIPSGCFITGDVSVQRYFKAGSAATTRNYRLLSSPVNINSVTNNSTPSAAYGLSYLSNNPGVYTGGPNGPTAGFTVINAAPTIYLYKESLPASNTSFNSGNFKGLTTILNNTIIPFNDAGTAADAAVTLYAGNGYMLYYVGNNVANLTSTTVLNKQNRVGGAYIAPDASTATAVGTLNQGAIPVKLWTGSSTLSNARTGFNLVGNPYASTIDWDTFSTSVSTNGIYGPGVSNSIYVFNYTSKNYGVYQAGMSGGTGTNNSSRYIASGQGFFVKATTGTATLTFNEASKSTSQPSFILMGMPAQTAQRTQLLRIRLAKDTIDSDESLVLFEPGGNNSDDDLDVPRINGIGNVATLGTFSKAGTQMLAINHLNSIDSATRVRLHVAMTGAVSRDSLIISGFDSLDPRYDAFLVDHYKNDSLQISLYGKYLFNIEPANSASFGANRFELVFHKKADFNYRLLSFTGIKTADGNKLTWKTERERDMTGFVLQKADGSLNYLPIYNVQSNGAGVYTYTDPKPAKGINSYRLQQNDPFGKTRFSNPINIEFDNGKADGLLVAYPNPVISDVSIQINTTDVPAKVQLRVIDFTGHALINKAVPGNNIQENLGALKSGTYIIEVADAVTQKVVGRTKISKP